MISGRDLLVLLDVAANGPRPVRTIGEELGIAKSAVDASVQRLKRAHLLTPDRRPSRLALVEFAEHAARYVFPAEPGKITLGMPTGWSYDPIAGELVGGDPVPVVIPLDDGEVRGRSIEPIDERAPQAAAKDPRLHGLLACIDAFRAGRARDRKAASDHFKTLLAS